MARPIYQYRPQNTDPDKALGLLLPLNKGAQGKTPSANYASGSSAGNGVFVSSYTTREAAVTNLKNLIMTQKGERYMQPNFGTNVRTILFENNTEEIRESLRSTIQQDIQYWLPYISLTDVEVTPSADYHSLSVRLSFQITNIGANVVINILASENEFSATEVESENDTEVFTQVDSFGSDTAFGLGTAGAY